MEYRTTRRRAVLLPVLSLAAFASALAAFTPVRSAGDPVDRLDHAAIQRPALQLPAPVHGADAVRLLGPRLNEIAARYGETGDSLAATLLRDQDLWLDSHSRLAYSCTFRFGPAGFANRPTGGARPSSGVEAAPFPLDQTFELHSLPASKRVIYLDFNGHLTQGTEWNEGGVGNIQSVPWSLDSNRASFSTNEQTAIQEIWQSVA